MGKNYTGQIIVGIIVTVVGGFILAWLVGDGRFSDPPITPQSTNTPQRPNLSPSPTISNLPTYPTSIEGTWVGTYNCLYEGKANVTLEILGNERINAVFSFSANRENPSHPSGAFNMMGTYDSREGIVKLEATTWIDEPGAENAIGNVDALTNSVKMDMVATVTESGARIEGRLDPVSGIDVCNKIEVARAN